MLPKAQELVDQIVEAVREEAKKIPWFNEQPNGAIMVCFDPKLDDAYDWLKESGAGYNNSLLSNKPCVTFCVPVNPNGGYVVTFPDDDVVDTEDYALKKIRHCAMALENGLGYVSGLKLPLPEMNEENGFGPYRGAIGFLVDAMPTDYCAVYVCVSGAKQMEDEQCAAAAIPVVRSFFEDREDVYFCVEEPKIPPEEEE